MNIFQAVCKLLMSLPATVHGHRNTLDLATYMVENKQRTMRLDSLVNDLEQIALMPVGEAVRAQLVDRATKRAGTKQRAPLIGIWANGNSDAHSCADRLKLVPYQWKRLTPSNDYNRVSLIICTAKVKRTRNYHNERMLIKNMQRMGVQVAQERTLVGDYEALQCNGPLVALLRNKGHDLDQTYYGDPL